MQALSHEIKGVIYVTLSGLFYGLIGYFGTNALSFSPDVANMLFWRFLIAALFIFLFLLPKLSHIKYDIPVMIIIFTAGAIFYGSSTYTYFLASQHLGTGVAMVIFFTYPAIVILCNWLLYRHQINRSYVTAMILIIIGLLLLIELKLGFNYQGLLLSLISAGGYAFYIMASKKNSVLHPLLGALMVCAGCCLFCFFFAFLNDGFTIPFESHFWLNSIGLGILSTALPVLFLLHGLKFISSEKAAILGVLEPIFVAITGVLLLGETLGLMQIIGVVIVLGGALISLLTQRAPHIIDTK